MGAVMTNISTTLRTISCLIVILLFVMTVGCNHQRLKREAGFYTTRYGRSDPMMRFKETQTRYFPDPVPAVPESNKQSQRNIYIVGSDLVENDNDSPPPVACEFSVKKRAYICKPLSSSPWKKIDNTMALSYS